MLHNWYLRSGVLNIGYHTLNRTPNCLFSVLWCFIDVKSFSSSAVFFFTLLVTIEGTFPHTGLNCSAFLLHEFADVVLFEMLFVNDWFWALIYTNLTQTDMFSTQVLSIQYSHFDGLINMPPTHLTCRRGSNHQPSDLSMICSTSRVTAASCVLNISEAHLFHQSVFITRQSNSLTGDHENVSSMSQLRRQSCGETIPNASADEGFVMI